MGKPYAVVVGLKGLDAYAVALYCPTDGEQGISIIMAQCSRHITRLRDEGFDHLQGYDSFYVFRVSRVTGTHVGYYTSRENMAKLPPGGIESLPVLTWGSELASIRRDLLKDVVQAS
jgi:hypothetical protein